MSKLVIHIGYPKTATTTLQESLFTELSRNGEINFLGKSLSDKKNNWAGNWGSFIDYLISEKRETSIQGIIHSNILNVVSNERLTQPRFNLEKIYKKEINTSIFPEKLEVLFSHMVDDIQILLSIRNQQSLIYSMYVQQYRLFRDDENSNTFEKYITNGLRDGFESYLSIYKFYDILKRYINVFGKDKVHVLFFEDLKSDKEFYLENLSNILGVNINKIKEMIGSSHYRKKIKTMEGEISEEIKNNILGKFFEKMMGRDLINKYFSKIYYDFPIIEKVYNKIARVKEEYLIPKQTIEIQKIIFEEFKGNNILLSSELFLDKYKLKKYGYI